MSKHTPTPGPWKFRTCYTKGEPVEYAVESQHPEHSGPIATVHITVDNDDEDYANARLIAAAPCLLAACKLLHRDLGRISPKVFDEEISEEAKSALKRALAKAGAE